MGDEVLCLTTVDNPYSPVTNWEEWYGYDHAKGHNTCEFLARVIDEYGIDMESLAEEDRIVATNLVIREIARLNVRGIDRAVTV